ILAIPLLLALCRPSAITRFIIPVIVYSIYGMTLSGSWTHINVKLLERPFPSSANFDASAAIPRISRYGRTSTPSKHGRPNSIFRSLRHSMSFLVDGRMFSRPLFLKAPTTTNRPMPKSTTRNNMSIATNTTADEIGVSRFYAHRPRTTRDYCQSSKPITSEIVASISHRTNIGELANEIKET
ncbi:hypothetical protein LCGC14_3046150, partial [marine sediment metagenome]